MTIADIFAEHVCTRPEAVALIEAWTEGERRLTYAALEKEVARAAGWLERQGLRKGQAALVFVPMSVELYVALLALFRLGAVAIFLDPAAGRAHVEHGCARWPPDALIATRKAHLLRLTSPALRRIPLKLVVDGWIPGACRWPGGGREKTATTAQEYGEVAAEHPALVTFTSGSTGEPKAAVRSHGFLLAQHRVLSRHLELEAGDVDLATLPVFVLANLASGVTTVIPDFDVRRPGAVEGRRIAELVERFGVTRIAASPAFFESLVEYLQPGARTLPTLKKLHTGGAPVFPRLLTALQGVAPTARVVAVYGSTEAEPIAHVDAVDVSPSDWAAMRGGRGLLAGRPVAEVSLRIVRDRWGEPRGAIGSEAFERETLREGEAGEIVVTGEHVLGGYLGGIGDAETKFAVQGEIWHRTGDAGRLDHEGRLWLLGRCAAQIDDAQGRLYPFAVECAAMECPEVRRVAMVSHQGRRTLVIEAKPEAPAGLAEKLKTTLAWAHVETVRFIAAMPVDARHNAKIDYPALQRWLEA